MPSPGIGPDIGHVNIFLSSNPSKEPLIKDGQRCCGEIGTNKITSQQRSPPRSTLLSWKAQISSLIASLFCFVAIVIVLQILDGRPLPNFKLKWVRARNMRPMDDFRTVDEASRGPWGSALLLIRGKGGFIGAFGALVTITALGISTFAQQGLDYVTVYPFTNEATIPVAHYLNSTGIAQLGDGTSVMGVPNELLSSPYTAFFRNLGTGGDGTTFIGERCSTGNRTWEFYQSLGICSRCEDLSGQLNATELYLEHTPDMPPLYWNPFNYSLPNGFTLTGSGLHTPKTGLMNVTTTDPNLQPVSGPFAPDGTKYASTIAFEENVSSVLDVFVIGPSPGTFYERPEMLGRRFKHEPPVAYECALEICVAGMSARQTDGRTSETTYRTWINDTKRNDRGIVSSTKSNLYLSGEDFDTTFIVTSQSLFALRSWLSSLMQGDATIQAGYISNDSFILFPQYSSDLIQQMASTMNRSADGFPKLMDQLARSISLNLRITKDQPPVVQGKAFTAISHAVVSWAWLVLPMVELVGSLVFLVVVMV
ncbi:hypothetical protein M011DRAFT_462072 [Sporormia fimetaria CBS 119925]|uniref:Uncharacterized protein n=1 Tax=Sporormia fimetaria CBS 119925 TaxID=1340428 RepID=A0A6A6UYY4_9PLEO|nr:hypothetical protein M011DRAFT_462072 [Sporormia fimetaria CBS 119925]